MQTTGFIYFVATETWTHDFELNMDVLDLKELYKICFPLQIHAETIDLGLN